MKKKVNEKKNIIEKIFLHNKPVQMLISLKSEKSKYTTQVSKDVDCTYSHTVKILDMFKKLGLVSFNKKGRIKNIKLTEDGEEIAHEFEGITKKFSRLATQLKNDIFAKKETKEKKEKVKG